MIQKIRKIAVLAGVSKSERKVSLRSARAVLNALKKMNFDCGIVDIGRGNLIKKVVSFKPDFCFIACHGSPGEDGTVQAALEILKIPYSSSGVLPSAVCMNKVLTKIVFESLNIRTAPGITLYKGKKYSLASLGALLPLVVKPSSEGSTVGVSLVRKKTGLPKALKKAFAYGSQVIVERYIDGREFTVGWLAGKVLPPLEIIPVNEYYDYESKYEPEMSRHVVPAEISKIETETISSATHLICRSMNLRGAARVDFLRSRGGRYYALEVNTIPGMTETSLLPEEAAAAGISFEKAVGMIIKDSLRK